MYRLNRQLVPDDGKASEKSLKVEEVVVTKIPAGLAEPGHSERSKPAMKKTINLQ